MSKYEDIVQLLAQRREQYLERRAAAQNFAAGIKMMVTEEYGCPAADVALLPPDHLTKPGDSCSPVEAVKHAYGCGDTWQFALSITFRVKPNEPPADSVKMELSIAASAGDTYVTTLRDTRHSFVLPASGERVKAHDELMRRIHERLGKTYSKENFLLFENPTHNLRHLVGMREI